MNRGTERRLLFTILGAIAILYFSTHTANHTEAEDSLIYLMTISRGALQDQFHPNHLLYGFANYGFFHFWRVLGFQGDAALPTKIINVLASISALLVLYGIAARLGLPFPLRIFCILTTAFTCGYWWYSVECETYVLPIVFVLLCCHRLLLIQADFSKPVNHLLLGLFNALAVVFHQQHVLMGVVILVAYVLMMLTPRPAIAWKTWLSRCFLYACSCAVVVLGSYLVVAVLVKDLSGPSEIATWMMGRAKTSPLHYGRWLLLSPVLAAIGFFRTIIGAHFLFSFEALSSLLRKLLPALMLREEVFLVGDFSGFRKVSLLILSVAFFLLATFLLTQAVRHRTWRGWPTLQPNSPALRVIEGAIAAYLLLYALFNMWFDPQNTEFWISLVPFVSLAVSLLLAPLVQTRRIQICLGVLVLSLFIVNLFGSILPQTDRQHDFWYAFDRWLIDNGRPGDLVVSGSGWISDAYVVYYSGAMVFSIFQPAESIEQGFLRAVDSFKPKRILFSSTVRSPPEEYLKRIGSDGSRERGFFEQVSDRLTLIHADSWQEIHLYHNEDAARPATDPG